MSISQLKKNISSLVEISSDKEFLEMLFHMLEDKEQNKDKDFWDDLTEEQVAGIEEGLEQIKRGQVVPHEEVMKSARQIILNGKNRKLVGKVKA